MTADRGRWEPIAVQAANSAGVDPALFVAMIEVESGFDPDAQSGAGAIGIAQIVPRWHPGVDVRDPYASLQYAARLLASHLQEFGSERLALAAYNAGAGAVHSVGNQVPNNGETPRYVEKILSLRGNTSVMAQPANEDSTTASSDPSPQIVTPNPAIAAVAAMSNPDPQNRRNIALIAAALVGLLVVTVVVDQ